MTSSKAVTVTMTKVTNNYHMNNKRHHNYSYNYSYNNTYNHT